MSGGHFLDEVRSVPTAGTNQQPAILDPGGEPPGDQLMQESIKIFRMVPNRKSSLHDTPPLPTKKSTILNNKSQDTG